MTSRYAALAREFERARAVRNAAARDRGPGVCRYCGQPRCAKLRSTLDGHARCIVTVEFMRLVREVLESDATVTYDAIAESCGVTQTTVRRWYQAALDAQGRPAVL